jgi:hypothetical protein
MHGATIEEIIRQADQAMYQSKSSGGDRVSLPPADRESPVVSQEAKVGM